MHVPEPCKVIDAPFARLEVRGWNSQFGECVRCSFESVEALFLVENASAVPSWISFVPSQAGARQFRDDFPIFRLIGLGAARLPASEDDRWLSLTTRALRRGAASTVCAAGLRNICANGSLWCVVGAPGPHRLTPEFEHECFQVDAGTTACGGPARRTASLAYIWERERFIFSAEPRCKDE